MRLENSITAGRLGCWLLGAEDVEFRRDELPNHLPFQETLHVLEASP
jgi:hypothetical protein